MSLLDKIQDIPPKEFAKGFLASVCGAVVGAYFFSHEASRIDVYDKDKDGYVDVIEDRNWGITIVNDSDYLIPVENIPKDRIICYFTESISLEGNEYKDKIRNVYLDCLKKN